MAPRRFAIRSEPPSKLEPEILAQVKIPELVVPAREEFTGYIEESEIPDLAKRDRKVILQLSVMEQWIDWLTENLVAANRQIIRLEADRIRSNLQQKQIRDEQKEQGWKWALLKWLSMTVGAGIVAALIRSLSGH